MTLWIVTRQATLSMGFSPGKKTGVGCCALLQGIILIQGSNLDLLHYRQILYHLSHPGSPKLYESLSNQREPWVFVLLNLLRSDQVGWG